MLLYEHPVVLRRSLQFHVNLHCKILGSQYEACEPQKP